MCARHTKCPTPGSFGDDDAWNNCVCSLWKYDIYLVALKERDHEGEESCEMSEQRKDQVYGAVTCQVCSALLVSHHSCETQECSHSNETK